MKKEKSSKFRTHSIRNKRKVKSSYYTRTAPQNSTSFTYDKETLKQRNWEAINKKIRFDYYDKSGTESNDQYFYNKPLSPGFAVWKFFAAHPRSFLKVDIRIPETLVVLGNNNFCYLSYDPVKRGIIKKTELEININDFEKIVEKLIDPRYLNKDYYMFIQRTPAGRSEMEFSKAVFNKSGWKQKKSTSSSLDNRCLLQ